MVQKYAGYSELSNSWDRSRKRNNANGCMSQSIHSWSTGFCRQRYNKPGINLWDLVGSVGLIGKIFFPSWRNIFSQVGKNRAMRNLQTCKTCSPPYTHARARKGFEENGDKNRKWAESTGEQGKLTKINILPVGGINSFLSGYEWNRDLSCAGWKPDII